ncbi:unnamed protein product, partial [Polarella glacialis]
EAVEDPEIIKARTAQEIADLWTKAVGCEADCAIVWLHGQGESEVAWQSVFENVKLPAHAGRCRWIWPRAELAPCSVRGGAMTAQWFDSPEYPICRVVRAVPDRPSAAEDPADVDAAVRYVRAVTDALEILKCERKFALQSDSYS